MSSIEELQQRVVRAEERFGLINAERAKYSERLMGLIDAIETRLGDQQSEIERQAGETASQAEELATLRQDSAENKLLRGMLQSLLNAIELGNSVALSETMQVLDAKISALIDDSKAAEAAPSEATAPEADEAGSDSAVAPESEPPEKEAREAEVPDGEVSDPAPLEAEMPEVEAAEAAGLDESSTYPLEEQSAAPAPEAAEAAPEPEAVPETDTVADEMQAAADPTSEPEAEAETGATEVLNIPASDANITIIDEVMVIDAASGEVPPVADATVESPVDPADAALDIPAVADGGEQKPEASSLEDIMRRVSKLVEDEGALGPLAAGGVQIDESSPYPVTQSPEPADAKKLASGG